MTDDRQKSILLVEDEAVIALNQKRQLIDEGYYVVHVFNGASALETLKNNNGKIDLILMDIDLGKGMNGPEIACEICKFSDIPIIFLSSHTDKESVELTEKSASYGYVLKQAGQAVLFASIKLAFKLWDANQKIKLRDKELEDTNRKLNIINETLENTNLKLKESEAQIRFITNNLPSSLLYQMDVGEDGSQRKFLHISDKVEVLHGVKAQDALKDSSIIYKQIVEEDIGALLEGEIEAIKKMKPFAKEVRIKLPSGEIKWRQFISEPVKLPEGGYIWNGIETDVTERKSTETVIKNTEKKFKSIVENSFEAVTLIDEVSPDISRTLYASENYLDMIGIPGSKMIGKTMYELFPKEHAEKFTKDDWDVVSSGRTLKIDEDLNNRAYYTIKFPIIQNDKKLLAGYTIEITDRKEKEEKIKKLLNEKEEILREVHHRIKNNMSTILSLFRIQSDKQENAVIKSVFLDASNRLKSMMVLYDKLYRSTNKNELRLKEYLTSLAEEIINIFPNRHKIESVIGVGNLMCKPEILSPLGIIVNEMINNSMKYAFNDKDKGKIKIFVKKRNDYAVFSYEDNGPGIPESVSLENTPGYGLRMIKSLVDQIDGSITLERNRGAKYVIKFII